LPDNYNTSAALWTDHQWNASGWRTPQDSLLSSLTPAATLVEWHSQDQCGFCLTLWRLAAFGDFQKKKRVNVRGFAREFCRSGMLYW